MKCCPDTFSSSHCSEKHFVLVCGCQFGQQELFSVSCWDRILAKVLCMQLSNPCGLWQVLHAFWRDIREIQSENGNYWNLLWVREKGLLEHESKFLSDSSQKSFGRKWEPTDFLSSDFFFLSALILAHVLTFIIGEAKWCKNYDYGWPAETIFNSWASLYFKEPARLRPRKNRSSGNWHAQGCSTSYLLTRCRLECSHYWPLFFVMKFRQI